VISLKVMSQSLLQGTVTILASRYCQNPCLNYSPSPFLKVVPFLASRDFLSPYLNVLSQSSLQGPNCSISCLKGLSKSLLLGTVPVLASRYSAILASRYYSRHRLQALTVPVLASRDNVPVVSSRY
jgi:hypothetical protein